MRLRPAAVALWVPVMVAVAMAWVEGCGVKSEPIPPEYAAPQQIVDLRAFSQARGIRLTWTRPERYVGGRTMRDLGHFDLLRAEDGGPYHPLIEIPVTDQQRFQQQHHFSYLDATAELDHSYRYQVVSETMDGYRSQGSNQVKIIRHKPTPPPNPETFKLPTPKLPTPVVPPR